MKRHAAFRTARFLCATVPVCLLLAGCDPVDSTLSGIPQRYKAPPLNNRRRGIADPENVRWFNAWRNLRDDLGPLQEKLSKLEEFQAQNQFDTFLSLDPETLDKDQLCTLFHFLDRGYFTVERKILIELLNRRLERTAEPVVSMDQPKTKLKDMLAAAMHRDELRMVDMETAIDGYSKAGTADIQIPNSLSDREHEELLTTVNKMLVKTRAEVARLDAKLERLKARAFPVNGVVPAEPEAPMEEDVPEAAPNVADAAESEPEPAAKTEAGSETGQAPAILSPADAVESRTSGESDVSLFPDGSPPVEAEAADFPVPDSDGGTEPEAP